MKFSLDFCACVNTRRRFIWRRTEWEVAWCPIGRLLLSRGIYHTRHYLKWTRGGTIYSYNIHVYHWSTIIVQYFSREYLYLTKFSKIIGLISKTISKSYNNILWMFPRFHTLKLRFSLVYITIYHIWRTKFHNDLRMLPKVQFPRLQNDIWQLSTSKK